MSTPTGGESNQGRYIGADPAQRPLEEAQPATQAAYAVADKAAGDEEKTAGEAFLELIKEQLAEQRARKKWIEDRAAAIITSSGALVTLLFGLSALVTDATGFALSGQQRFLLAAAAGSFFLAVLSGLVTTFPWPYTEAIPAKVREWVDKEWDEPIRHGRIRMARAHISIWRDARKINGIKVWFLFAGIALEVVAIVLVALTVVDVLARGALLSRFAIPSL